MFSGEHPFYTFNVINEPEVKHMVGLIKHKGPDTGEIHIALTDKVKHAPRRCDQYSCRVPGCHQRGGANSTGEVA